MKKATLKVMYLTALLHAGESPDLPAACIECIMKYLPDCDRCTLCEEHPPHLVIDMHEKYFWCIDCYIQMRDDDDDYYRSEQCSKHGYGAVRCYTATFTSPDPSNVANTDVSSVAESL